MTKVFVIRHVGEERLGSIRHVLEEKGVEYRYIEAPHEDLSSINPLEPDVLFVMGGPIGVYQADLYPFLNDEIKILEKRLAADKPTLGICLGAQLMAKALGANVYKGDKGMEIGWHPVSVNEAGKKTPLQHLDQAQTNMFHWHGDTFDMPKGATLLASNANFAHQAFSHGQNALGVQFHPEVTERMLREWFIALVDCLTGPKAKIQLEDLRAQTAQNIGALNAQCKKFITEWLESRI